MPVDVGINFRSTAGYVTDGAGETYCLAEPYPVTRGGYTFGWTTVARTGADRASGNDRRLAGINFSSAGSVQTFRLDLPNSGTYVVHLAIGDASGGLSSTTVRILDNGSLLATIAQVSIAANNFTDASGTNRTNVTWPTNEVASGSLTFASTVFQLDISSSGVAFEGLAHVRIVETGGVATKARPPFSRRWHYWKRRS